MSNIKPNKHHSQSLWDTLQDDVAAIASEEPLLANFFYTSIQQHSTLEAGLSYLLAQKLQNDVLSSSAWQTTLLNVFTQNPTLIIDILADLQAIRERDCACNHYYQAFCFFKGFHALSAYRVMHALWLEGHLPLALLLQNRISVVLGVDIHPAARIGNGVMLDHATGIVVGETAVVGNNVSIMQAVTLGGTGKESGDRHPKIHDGVLISVGATILGNIEIGEGAQIAAGSVVLESVPPHTLVAGVPAKIVGKPHSAQPALIMDHQI